MLLFHTATAAHLTKKIRLAKGKQKIKRFSDGEIHVHISPSATNKLVWVIAGTQPPAENILELAFLLDALKQEGVAFKLLFTYFGYARQDKAESGDAFAGKVICEWLSFFKPEKIFICHMHSSRLTPYLEYKNIIPHELFEDAFKKADALAIPDEGALEAGKTVSQIYKLPLIQMTKTRAGKEKVRITDIEGDVQDKRIVLFDDMITTGHTLIEATKVLKKKGARSVAAVATHGVFSGKAIELLNQSNIFRITVTNSLVQRKHSHKIHIKDISAFVEKTMKQDSPMKT